MVRLTEPEFFFSYITPQESSTCLKERDFELNMVLFAENTSIGGYDAMCVAALLFAQGSQPVFFSVYLCVLGLHQRRALAPPPQDCSSVKIINKNGVML